MTLGQPAAITRITSKAQTFGAPPIRFEDGIIEN
jgi:hypothetical protein